MNQRTLCGKGVSRGRVCGCGFWLWQVTGDTQHLTYDILYVTCDMRQVTQDMWHMTHDTWHLSILVYGLLSARVKSRHSKMSKSLHRQWSWRQILTKKLMNNKIWTIMTKPQKWCKTFLGNFPYGTFTVNINLTLVMNLAIFLYIIMFWEINWVHWVK